MKVLTCTELSIEQLLRYGLVHKHQHSHEVLHNVFLQIYKHIGCCDPPLQAPIHIVVNYHILLASN